MLRGGALHNSGTLGLHPPGSLSFLCAFDGLILPEPVKSWSEQWGRGSHVLSGPAWMGCNDQMAGQDIHGILAARQAAFHSAWLWLGETHWSGGSYSVQIKVWKITVDAALHNAGESFSPPTHVLSAGMTSCAVCVRLAHWICTEIFMWGACSANEDTLLWLLCLSWSGF